jgi:protein SCO1/2
VGSSVDRLILYCFHYDEAEGRYAPVAMNIMRLGGGLTALGLGGFLGAYWLKVARKRLSRSRRAIASARLGSPGSPVEDAGS